MTSIIFLAFPGNKCISVREQESKMLAPASSLVEWRPILFGVVHHAEVFLGVETLLADVA